MVEHPYPITADPTDLGNAPFPDSACGPEAIFSAFKPQGHTPEEIAAALNLSPLPLEGGMYRSTFARREAGKEHDLVNSIFYMEMHGQFSHLHRLPHDEIYNYHMGDPLELLELCPDGSAHRYILGPDIFQGQVLQAVIHRGCWQGSRVLAGGDWCLVDTVSIPGYEDATYEHCMSHLPLLAQYPEYGELIRALCPEE